MSCFQASVSSGSDFASCRAESVTSAISHLINILSGTVAMKVCPLDVMHVHSLPCVKASVAQCLNLCIAKSFPSAVL